MYARETLRHACQAALLIESHTRLYPNQDLMAYKQSEALQTAESMLNLKQRLITAIYIMARLSSPELMSC